MEPTLLGDRYEILDLLGAGGMGEVFRARHVVSGRVVALKKLRSKLASNEKVAHRLILEARAASALRHPNVIEVLDANETGPGGPFVVFELLEGETLGELLTRRGKLPWSELAPLLLPVLDALGAAHERGIIHRDLKPDNIFLSRAEGSQAITPKLLDFGIAKLSTNDHTESQLVFGTIHYMAPELFSGAKLANPRSDIWSFGALLYEALSGSPPYAGETLAAVVGAVLSGARLPLQYHVPQLEPHVARAIEQALQVDPETRFGTARQLGRALREDDGRDASAAGSISMAPPSAHTMPSADAPITAASATGTRPQLAMPRRVALPALLLVCGILASIAAVIARSNGAATAVPDRTNSAPPTDHGRPIISQSALAAGVSDGSPRAEIHFPGATVQLGSDARELDAAQTRCRALLGERACPVQLFERERAHTVTLAGFTLDVREVSATDFARWLERMSARVGHDDYDTRVALAADGSVLAALHGPTTPFATLEFADGRFTARGAADAPALYVTWHGAERYCAARGDRLPSADEWEYGARGTARRVYPWGDALPSCDRVRIATSADGLCASAALGPLGVGTLPTDRTPEGVHDLGGNVAEWTADVFAGGDARCASLEERCHVYKGGDFASPEDRVRAASVSRARAGELIEHLGFRCASSLRSRAEKPRASTAPAVSR